MTFTPLHESSTWEVIPVKDEQREILVRTLNCDSIIESANAGVRIAELSQKYGLENNVYYSISSENLSMILHGQAKGPVIDEYFLLAKEIDLELGVE